MKYRQILFILSLVVLFGCRSPELRYNNDGNLCLQEIAYSGVVEVFYPNSTKWTEVSYVNGVPKVLTEWDNNGKVKSKINNIPDNLRETIMWEWEHHRRHLPIKTVREHNLQK